MTRSNSPNAAATDVAVPEAPMLAVDGVSVTFERERVLDRVHMRVEPGTRLGCHIRRTVSGDSGPPRWPW